MSQMTESNEVSYLTLIPFRRLLEVSGIRGYRDSAESRHRMVMALFPHVPENEARSSLGVLFRGERSKSESTVLIRSNRRPANIPGLKSLKEDFRRFELGQGVRFRVTVSPLKRSGNRERTIQDFDELESWLSNKFLPGLTGLEIIQLKEEEVRRGRSKNFVKLVQIDGIARINDLSALATILKSGVGRNKSYGAGLLTLANL